MCHPEVPEGEQTPDVERIESSVPLSTGEQMPALLTRPDAGRGPGVVVVGDFFGARTPFYEYIAARLSAAGFHALLPEYFFRQGPLTEFSKEKAIGRRGQLDDRRALDDLDDALDFLQSHEGVTGTRTGIIGFCIGGTFVLNISARRDDIAPVSFYGFPGGTPGSTTPAPPPLDQASDMTGPILGFWGDADESVPMGDVEQLARLLDEKGTRFERHIYPGLPHGFLSASQLDPHSEIYDDACHAWTRTIGFLREELS